MQRRRFLQWGLVGASAAIAPRCARSPWLGQLSTSNAGNAMDATPKVYQSQGGLLEATLQARPQTVQLGDRPASLLTYNGQMPGPRLEARPGDTVRLQFDNRLDQPTNLHYHGLHIPPTGTADNVFLEIPPGERYQYEFQIPADHPAGTFWYHPHLHGLVAEQLFGGLAGLFVVRGQLDEIPEIQAAQEAFMVLKDFALTANGAIPEPGHMAQMTGRVGDLLTVNGQFNPSVAIAPGGLLRLRLLNASSSRFFALSLANHPLHLIATDGGAIAAPVELDELVLAPGERAEVLVRGDQTPGSYRLLNRAFNPAQGMMGGLGRGPGMMGGMGRGPGMMGAPETPRNADQLGRREAGLEAIATVVYEGDRQDTPLPNQLIAVEPLPEPQQVRQFTLNHGMGGGMGMGMGGGMVFLINGQPFAHDRIDTQVALNAVEEWEIINTGMMAHPFHVHTNKFQIMARNGEPAPYRAWKDIVNVAPGETARIRIAFRDYPGKTVYHCHILDHEDRGMMGTLQIQA
ncbi:multicopper oxidase family protein [Leptolyngbya iicbica]|uniref:Multicopper oxidase family protein n=2 Tax=Cyanophyceae TaxID=3028117 RepID=A0A4Q7EEK9_9CYAN|nr:multicopper oxidase family protein [Leptolyngbya sp. LK]RZM81951.1 multicopper oxidase family protein [Leptolyngbya sp. LK]